MKVFWYADDTKIVGSEGVKSILQTDIDSAIPWSEENIMNFNFTNIKFKNFSLENSAYQELIFQRKSIR